MDPPLGGPGGGGAYPVVLSHLDGKYPCKIRPVRGALPPGHEALAALLAGGAVKTFGSW